MKPGVGTWHTSAVTLLAAAALLAGCAASKPERFHSLLASELAPPAAAAGSTAIVVDMLPVSVPPMVDQPQWVLRAADDSLQVLEQERWAAPLRDELRTALLEQLVARWGAVDARSLPQAGPNVWQLRVDVQRFESVPGREARIESSWSVLPPRNAAALTCRSTVRESVSDASVLGLAAAHRRGVARLADEIGKRLSPMQRGESVSCGAT